MKVPWLDLVLVAVIVVGGIFAWRSTRSYLDIRREHKRLTEKVGDLPVSDPKQIHILAYKTDIPLEFVWRVYLPPKYNLRVQHSHGSSSGTNAEAVNDVIRIRLRDADGMLYLHEKFPSSSGLMGMPDELQKFMHGRWDQIEVEQIGAHGLEVIPPDQPFVLLRLKMPPAMQQEAEEKLSPGMKQQYVPIIFESRVGR